ncbi:NifB/NifX family molybdenum-iron cluster-binding protein [bacterium]|nr:NifB/NifX family molybdenum-iron cluster-binding protein [bacterium]
MKIAFTTKGIYWDSVMDSRFGRTEYILVYDDETKELTNFDNRSISNEAHGAGPKTAQKLYEFNPDILITGNGPGGNAASVLKQAGIKVFIGASEMSVKEAYEKYKNNVLEGL